MLRELAREEMQRMGGAGDGNNGGDRDRDYGRSSYGAQANGFQPNWAAKGYGLFQDPCTGSVVTGAIAMAGATWPAVTAVRLALRRPQPSST